MSVPFQVKVYRPSHADLYDQNLFVLLHQFRICFSTPIQISSLRQLLINRFSSLYAPESLDGFFIRSPDNYDLCDYDSLESVLGVENTLWIIISTGLSKRIKTEDEAKEVVSPPFVALAREEAPSSEEAKISQPDNHETEFYSEEDLLDDSGTSSSFGESSDSMSITESLDSEDEESDEVPQEAISAAQNTTKSDPKIIEATLDDDDDDTEDSDSSDDQIEHAIMSLTSLGPNSSFVPQKKTIQTPVAKTTTKSLVFPSSSDDSDSDLKEHDAEDSLKLIPSLSSMVSNSQPTTRVGAPIKVPTAKGIPSLNTVQSLPPTPSSSPMPNAESHQRGQSLTQKDSEVSSNFPMTTTPQQLTTLPIKVKRIKKPSK